MVIIILVVVITKMYLNTRLIFKWMRSSKPMYNTTLIMTYQLKLFGRYFIGTIVFSGLMIYGVSMAVYYPKMVI